MNYYDRERRTEGDNPTLGLILCPDRNDAVVKYTLGEQQRRNIFASRYQLHLPTVEELQHEIRRELRQLVPLTDEKRRKKAAGEPDLQVGKAVVTSTKKRKPATRRRKGE